MNRRDFLRISAAAPLLGTSFAQEAGGAAAAAPKAAVELMPLTIRGKLRVSDRHWRNFAVQSLSRHPNLLDPEITPPTQFSKYGGDQSRKFKETGFFRVEKAEDRWWFVDPEGCAFLSVGVNTFSPTSSRAAEESFPAKFPTGGKSWADTEVPRIRSWGFNTASCWCDDKLLSAATEKIAYTPNRWPAWEKPMGPLEAFSRSRGSARPDTGPRVYFNSIIPIFSGEFQRFVESAAPGLAASKDDPWILGRFTDNELPFPDLDAYLSYNGTDSESIAGRKAATAWLKERKGGAENPIADDADRDAWCDAVYERYLSIVVTIIRKNDPNHMVFGPRLHGKSQRTPSIVKAIGRWCDVICGHPYGHWSSPPQMVEEWTELSGKPVMITELYAKGEDARMDNESGVGFLVGSQRDRGLYYQNHLINTMRLSSVIGWHWHRYMDHHYGSDSGSNKGLVSLDYEPYGPAVDLMEQLNRRIYPAAHYIRQLS